MSSEIPDTQYARDGDIAIAYQVVGEGPLDLIFMLGRPPVGFIEQVWNHPEVARFLRRLASFARLILFDLRGMGLSDRGFSVYTFEDGIADIRAVMEDVGSDRAAVFGLDVGGRLALMFAATHPDRTRAVITFGSHPTTFKDLPDYPWGSSHEEYEVIIDRMSEQWGDLENAYGLLRHFAATKGDDAFTRKWFASVLRTLSRREAIASFRSSIQVDVRPLLPTIQVPVLVMHKLHDEGMTAASRYLAEHIPGAQLAEFPGVDHWPFFENPDPIIDRIQHFLTGSRGSVDPDRVLATVLFSDIVGSTERAASLGDRKWRDLLDAHDNLTGDVLEQFRGRLIGREGDGFLATFDGPARAIRCALAIRDGVRTLGLETRAGLHTGEIEIRGEDVGGIAVHIGARVAAKAGAGEVFVSRTVADLVVGSDIEFEDRGVHALKGVPNEWQLYAVKA
jgi:pimeloyl-ACP methyl ester carboxylesterase/class 3 adenylate cyclase